MTTVDTVSRKKDFYAELMAEIEAGNIDRAVEMVKGLSHRNLQLEMLSQLAFDYVSALEHIRNHDLNPTFSPDIDDVPNANPEYVSSMDQNRARARILASTLKYASTLERDTDLASTLSHANTLANDLNNDLTLASTISDDLRQDSEFPRAGLINKTIIMCLELVLIELKQNNDLSLPKEVPLEESESIFQFTLTGIDTLTPHNLANIVSPYLQAVFDLQRTIFKISNKLFVESRIKFISQNSPIEINLTGVSETAALLRDELTPWRRKYAKKIADLEAKIKTIEIENNEIKKQRELVALEKDKLELQQAKIDMALNFVDKIASGLPDNQRIVYSIEILKSLNILVESPLEISNISKPETLPP